MRVWFSHSVTHYYNSLWLKIIAFLTFFNLLFWLSLRMGEQPRYMSDCEKRLAKLWHAEDEESVEEIARRLRRDRCTIWRLLGLPEGTERTGVGRKAAMGEEDKDRLVVHVDKLVKKAAVRYTVTLAMIHATFRMQPPVCDRVLQEAMHERGIWFHKLREKPILTDDDIEERYQWSKTYRKKLPAFFQSHIQLHIDNHAFKVPTTGDARKMVAAKLVHGSYREAGASLKREHVKPNKKLRVNTGTKNVLVAGGVGSGKVLLWHVVENTWCGDEAAALYSGPLAKALAKEYPTKRTHRLLEDNDPAGYQSGKAKRAKADLPKLELFSIPKRSPDLNVMDYYVWAAIERRLRQDEFQMSDDERESREEFVRRLRKTAKALPRAEVNKAIGDLARRAELLYRAKGGLFEESQEL
jgi:hypothetical protein